MSSLRSLGRYWAWALVGVLLVQPLWANPLKSPRRLINNQTVDLITLFKWWTNHTGARPLTGWVHITGSIVGTNSWGWIIEAKAEGPGHSKATGDSAGAARKESGKLLLQHPPLQDFVDFQKLKAELDTLNQNRKQFLDQETQAKNQSEVIAKEKMNVSRNSAEARALTQESKQSNVASHQASSAIKQLDLRIRPLKEKLATYPSSDHYLVDCFALDTGQETQSTPVYDHGAVFQ